MSALRYTALCVALAAACTGNENQGVRPTPDASTVDAVTPGADVVTPEPDVVTPGPDVVTPPADVVAPPVDAPTGTNPITTMPGHEDLALDTSPKRGPRMMSVESYVRSYLTLFGGLSPTGAFLVTPLAAQTQIRATSTDLFDTWNDYLATLGLPDYRVDLPRNVQMNALMLATLERTGMALCDVAVRRELEATTAVPVAQRSIFAFDRPTTGPVDLAGFTTRFDVLHRTFFGYPAAQAPTGRTQRFYDLYAAAAARPTTARATRFTPASDAGWAVVCYALVRHPEFQLY